MINNKKGFTLVEVIIVLVVLAILAAILIPSFVSYIEKAEKRTVVVETRNVMLAAKAAVIEEYALDKAQFTTSGQGACKYTGENGKPRGRVTSNMLYTIQNSGSTDDKEGVDAAIARNVLDYLSSGNKKTAEYVFSKSVGPHSGGGMNVSDYYATYKQPGVIICYTPEGEIDFIEFGLERYMAHMDGTTGEITIYDGKDGGKYSKYPT